MKKLSLITLALACITTSLAACAQQINFDPDYIMAEQQKCNQEPLHAVEKRCKSEKADGKEFKPACDAVDRVNMVNSNHQMAGFFSPSLRKKEPQCAK